MRTATALSGWYVDGSALSHDERAAGETAFARIEHGPYERKSEAERVRDHYLYGPYTTQDIRIVHRAAGSDDTLVALLAEDARYRAAELGEVK